jgi:peptidoglycan-N-acetylglucosamine deacetylase
VRTLLCFVAFALSAQARTVAITVDDLPYAGEGSAPDAEAINKQLLNAFQTHHVPVTGFVVQQRVESLGSDRGTNLLRQWTKQGLDLGNHTWSHSDVNDLSVARIEDEIVRGESTIGPLMKEAGRKIEFFRFPFNHTGDTNEKHDAIAAFLAGRGYRLAVCTIDTSDYVFNNAYLLMLAKKDEPNAKRLRADYLAYSETEIDYYAALNRQVLGYEPPEVMLLHANRLNAEMINAILLQFQARGYRFVTLTEALSDPAYQIPETYITKSGMMWGYRWARERNVKVNGKLETEPPPWVPGYR